jgi:hypothetical protein
MSGNSFLSESSTVSRKSLLDVNSFVRLFGGIQRRKCVNRLVDDGSRHFPN